ncbi:MAG: hypothetical protein WB930_06060 [Syntrophobacteraceae bacterium]
MSEELTTGTAAPKKRVSVAWVWMGVAAHVIVRMVVIHQPHLLFTDALARAVGGSLLGIGLSILVLAPVVGSVITTTRDQPLYCRYNVTIAVWVGLIFQALGVL